MAAETATNIEEEARSRPLLLPLIAAATLGILGFGATFTGLLTPLDWLQGSPSHRPLPVDETITFVALPPIEISLAGGRHRSLALSATIETSKQAEEQIKTLMPRITDSFNGFLAGVDPYAFDKRGVLEIIKYELTVRAKEALPDLPVNDLLITEFRLK
ncbi:flagellar basal body-associated FliL family protein [Paracoccus tegillarcae]|uniref:Flagellar protein FliL n=1 Tax=Paracoccus tegillarcae TaxID=1529068 RepID=A0A2K9EFM3_9RHOB|nr:flagellar basal body-associated FliL family protein [Paracoccus tegillarcae]AUH33758.1 flagellar basal body protein FliL [Paracoccus tegillarcae]